MDTVLFKVRKDITKMLTCSNVCCSCELFLKPSLLVPLVNLVMEVFAPPGDRTCKKALHRTSINDPEKCQNMNQALCSSFPNQSLPA